MHKLIILKINNIMSNEQLINTGFQCGMRLLSQYLNFKCGEQEFKNPFLNGLQMGVMSASTQDIIETQQVKNQSPTDIAMQCLTPILFGFATTADDLLMNKGLTSKHYLTDLMSVFATGKLLSKDKILEPNNYNLNVAIKDPKIAYGISAGLLGIKYLQEYLTGSKGYIETQRTLNTKVAKNIKDLEYVTNGVVNIKSAVATQVILNEVIDTSIEIITVEPMIKAQIKKSIEIITIERMIKAQIKNSSSLFKLIGDFIISSTFSVIGMNEINKRNNEIINSPNSLLKISSNGKMSNTLNDIDKISTAVNGLSTNILMMNSSLIGMSSLTKAFPILNLRSSLGEMLNHSDTVEIQKEISDITSYMNKSKQSLITNPRTVIERDGLKYFVDKNQDNQHKLKYFQDKLTEKTSGTIPIMGMSIIDGLAASYATMNIDAVMKTWTAVNFIKSLPNVEVLTPSLERLTELYKFLENSKNTSYVNYHSYNGSNLYLKDIKIDIAGVNKLNLAEMTLEGGKWYLLTGKSGCGKTTFMSTLRGLPNFADAIEIRGDAYYPKLSTTDGSKIYMLTQTNNFPYMVPMLEAVLYPMVNTAIESKSYKSLVKEIMLKMEGYSSNSAEGKEYLENGLLSRLDERINDITSETSGGQQKKMSITGMIVRIMKETGMLDIYNQEIADGKSHDNAMEKAKNSVGSVLVLIDETFNGLDSGANGGTFANSSKGLVLKTLKESLPSKAIVVSVEHQPQLDQYYGRIHLNGDGTYQYTGSKATMNIPTEYESFDPLKDIIGDIESL
jgi:ABC-type lipoprotein export system ATPase subunit